MKEKIVSGVLNIFKVKSIVTFVAVYVFAHLALTQQIEAATTTAILMMVFQNLFDKNKSGGSNNDNNI